MISAFIIPCAIAKAYREYRLRDFPLFLLRRATRIEPPYILSIGIVLVLGYMSSVAPGFQRSAPTINRGQIGAHFLYLIPSTEFSWLQPDYWSIAWEFIFYVVVRMTFPYVTGVKDPAAWWGCTWLASGLVFAGIPSPLAVHFLIGTAIFRQVVFHEKWTLPIVQALAVLTVWTEGACVGAVTLVAALLILWGGRLVIPGRAGRLLMRFGELSYSLYLVHVPIGGRIVNLRGQIVSSPVQQFSLSALALVISIAAAALYWKLVEAPSTRAHVGFLQVQRERLSSE